MKSINYSIGMWRLLLPMIILTLSLISCETSNTRIQRERIEANEDNYQHELQLASIVDIPNAPQMVAVGDPGFSDKMVVTEDNRVSTPVDKDDNPVYGTIDIGGNTYTVHCGKKNVKCQLEGSLYINKVSKETGEPYRMYLNAKHRTKVIKS